MARRRDGDGCNGGYDMAEVFDSLRLWHSELRFSLGKISFKISDLRINTLIHSNVLQFAEVINLLKKNKKLLYY